MSKTVRDIQARLAELGIYLGKIDGIKGKKTVLAIRGFQRISGLRADGIAGQATRAALWPLPVVSRDLDPEDEDAVPPDVPLWPRQRDVEAFYGGPGTHQTMLMLPFTMKLAWDKRQNVHRFSVHEKVHDSAKRCFERIADAYDEMARELIGINLWGGCFNIRPMTGGTRLSMHSWGIAIDFDPARNGFRLDKKLARLMQPDCETFWHIWEDEGWVSLGRTCGFDPMHVQAARL